VQLFPGIIRSLQSSFTVVRVIAAKCMATLCDVITEEGMKMVVDEVVPLVGDATRVSARQGAVEAIHHIIRVLDIKALPYVLFLIVPILGRMSDSDESVRLLSTSTFAALVKMVPLEVSVYLVNKFAKTVLISRRVSPTLLASRLSFSRNGMMSASF
jgi:TATA-binding protein-associated factor